jgi:hypothetical protein
VKVEIFRQRRRHNAYRHIDFDEHMGLAVFLDFSGHRTDIESGMRPGRLRQIFDHPGDSIVALDQQNVTGSKRCA